MKNIYNLQPEMTIDKLLQTQVSEDSCFKLACVNIHFEMKDHCKAFFLKLCQLSALHLIIVLY